MANNLGMSQSALPNPFQSSIVPQVVSSTAKTTRNDMNHFHGYRSNFDINQQKEQYQQRLNQQQNQTPHFHRNGPQRNYRTDRNATAQEPNQSNGSYSSNWCDLCERGFKFPQQLEKHRGEHEKCWFDNCTFEGHSTLLQKHIEAQHQSGLFQRVANVETEEDIEKWREERRKRYPTKANIELRRKAQEERLKRGERIDEPNHRFGNTNNRNRAQHRSFTQDQNDSNKNQQADKKKNRRRTRNRNKNKNEKDGKVGKETTSEKTDAVKTETVSGSTTEIQCPVDPKEKSLPNSSALASIMGMYGLDSDSDRDDEEAPPAESAKEECSDAIIGPFEPEKVAENSPIISEQIESNEKSDEVPVESTNLKRSASFSDDSPAKMPKVESDVNENIKQDIDHESEDEAPDEQPVQRQSDDLEKNEQVESGPTKIKPEGKPKTKSSDEMSKRRTVLDMTRKIRNQNTLLEKLLQKDIRHERNVLLQCVRYVVENNFFGIGQTADEQNNQIEPKE